MKIFLSYLTLFILTFLTYGNACAQRTLFLEIGGSGGLGSINYEYQRPEKPHKHTGYFGHECPYSEFKYTWRGGIGLSPIDKNNGWVIVMPMMFNVYYQKEYSSHALEAGAGFAPSFTTTFGGAYIKSPLFFGYRWNPDARLMFRAGYTPIVGWLVDFQWQHWAGISIGYKLGNKHEE